VERVRPVVAALPERAHHFAQAEHPGLRCAGEYRGWGSPAARRLLEAFAEPPVGWDVGWEKSPAAKRLMGELAAVSMVGRRESSLLGSLRLAVLEGDSPNTARWGPAVVLRG